MNKWLDKKWEWDIKTENGEIQGWSFEERESDKEERKTNYEEKYVIQRRGLTGSQTRNLSGRDRENTLFHMIVMSIE